MNEAQQHDGEQGAAAIAGSTSLLKRLWPWAAIVVLALGVRLAYVASIRTIPFFDTYVGDAAGYDAWARQIAGGDWLGAAAFYQAPAYPYFLAAVYRVVGDSPMAVRAVQAGLGSLACLFLGLAGARFFSREAGLLAGVVLALYPPAIFFDGLVQKASLGLVLMAALLWRLGVLGSLAPDGVRASRRALGNWLCVGLLLGVFGLTRENALVLIVVVLGWMVFGFRAWRFAVRAGWIGAFALGLILTLGTVAYRNHCVGGVWAVTTVQAGPNFYIGNHAGATGRYTPLVRGHESPPFEQADAKRLAEEAVGTELSDSEVSQYWMGQAAAYIRGEPLAWLALLGRKCLLAVNAYEITDTEGFVVYRDYSFLLGGLSRVLHFGVVFPLALAGVVLAWRRHPGVRVLAAVGLAVLLSVVAFYVFARYRFPLVPVAVVLASAGAVAGWRRWQAGDRKGVMGAAATLVVATLLCNWPVNPERQLNAMAYLNLGSVLAQQGNTEGAAAVFAVALEENPNSPEVHYNLGLAYRVLGYMPQAGEHFIAAKQLDPDLIEVDYQLGALYEALGRLDAALMHYREAVRVDPDDAEAAAAIARVERAARP